MRLAAALNARANTDSNSTGDRTSNDQTSADRTTSGSTTVDHSNPDRTARTGASDSLANSSDAFANTPPWRHAPATSGHGLGKRATRTAAAVASRSTALRYAAWGWPVTPSTALPATTDLEQVFATWSRLPDAPILAACGVAFDVVETHAVAGRTALARLDRLGVDLGPITIDSVGRIGFLVRADSAALISTLIDPATGPALIGHGAHFELPRALDQPEPFRQSAATGRFWLRPPGTPCPALPTAHVVLGALALVPHYAPVTSPLHALARRTRRTSPRRDEPVLTTGTVSRRFPASSADQGVHEGGGFEGGQVVGAFS